MLDAGAVVVLAEAVDLAVAEEGAHRLVRRELDAAFRVGHDDGAEARAGHLPAAVDLGRVELDVPVAREAEDVAVPVDDREHRVGVRRDVVDRREAVRVLRRARRRRPARSRGRSAGSFRRRSMKRNVTSSSGVAMREGPEVAAPLLVRLDLGEERRAPRLEKAPTRRRRPGRGRRGRRCRRGGSGASGPRGSPAGRGWRRGRGSDRRRRRAPPRPPSRPSSREARATSVKPSASV